MVAKKVATAFTKISFLCFVFVFFQGCMYNQSQVSLYIDSDPSGAAVISGGKHMGTTPMTLYYDVIPEFVNGQDLITESLEVIWASGAFLKYEQVNLNKTNSFSQQIMFDRPSSFPNLEIDLAAASKTGGYLETAPSYGSYSTQETSNYNNFGLTTETGGGCAGSAFGAYNPCNPFSEYNRPDGALNPNNPFSEVTSPFGSLNPDNPFSEVTSPFGSLNPDNPFSEVTSPFGSLNPDNPFSEVTSPFGSLNPNNPFSDGTLQPALDW